MHLSQQYTEAQLQRPEPQVDSFHRLNEKVQESNRQFSPNLNYHMKSNNAVFPDETWNKEYNEYSTKFTSRKNRETHSFEPTIKRTYMGDQGYHQHYEKESKLVLSPMKSLTYQSTAMDRIPEKVYNEPYRMPLSHVPSPQHSKPRDLNDKIPSRQKDQRGRKATIAPVYDNSNRHRIQGVGMVVTGQDSHKFGKRQTEVVDSFEREQFNKASKNPTHLPQLNAALKQGHLQLNAHPDSEIIDVFNGARKKKFDFMTLQQHDRYQPYENEYVRKRSPDWDNGQQERSMSEQLRYGYDQKVQLDEIKLRQDQNPYGLNQRMDKLSLAEVNLNKNMDDIRKGGRYLNHEGKEQRLNQSAVKGQSFPQVDIGPNQLNKNQFKSVKDAQTYESANQLKGSVSPNASVRPFPQKQNRRHFDQMSQVKIGPQAEEPQRQEVSSPYQVQQPKQSRSGSVEVNQMYERPMNKGQSEPNLLNKQTLLSRPSSRTLRNLKSPYMPTAMEKETVDKNLLASPYFKRLNQLQVNQLKEISTSLPSPPVKQRLGNGDSIPVFGPSINRQGRNLSRFNNKSKSGTNYDQTTLKKVIVGGGYSYPDVFS